MKNARTLKKAVLVAVAAMACGQVAKAGVGFGIDLHIDAPPPVVIVQPPVVVAAPAVVVVNDPYLVGYRQPLYDADLRLRVAQEQQYQARTDLDAARAHEADAALDVDDQSAAVDDSMQKAHAADAASATARDVLAHAADDTDAAKAKVDDLNRHAARAKADLDAVRAAGLADFDAASRFHHAQAAVAAAQADLDDLTGRLARLQASDPNRALAEARANVHAAELRLGQLKDALSAAHDDVYACQQRLEDRTNDVCVALHDRDEALFLLHRDEIIRGTVDCAAFGFVIDAGWRSHWHGDLESLHAYCVHPVAYWESSPLLIVDRVEFVDHVGEIGRIRDVERVHAVDKIRMVERFETTVKLEDRRQLEQTVKVEQVRYTTERTERATASREGRKPNITYVSRPSDVKVTQLRHADAVAAQEGHELNNEKKANAALSAENQKDAAQLHQDHAALKAVRGDDREKTAELNSSSNDKGVSDNVARPDDAAAGSRNRHSRTPAAASDGDASSASGSKHSRNSADTGTTPSDDSRRGRSAAPDAGSAPSDGSRHSRTAPADNSSAPDTSSRHSRSGGSASDSGAPSSDAAPRSRGRHTADDGSTPPADPSRNP